jgi:hypothetical protein
MKIFAASGDAVEKPMNLKVAGWVPNNIAQ